ncbi:hypothetical protein EXIGLDRAFT_755338 [Exidia glandulosa HHB12029]|uniref:F-box domain-containing protein n=1 Tax=Exidia glandulosa HHB12029 TaxID=1314781 RepID=A0A165C4Z9_EXIGL|nr:hypothetical protein EXIGLDRAFT_755338 [Exidia glandulosa HHB12029]
MSPSDHCCYKAMKERHRAHQNAQVDLAVMDRQMTERFPDSRHDKLFDGADRDSRKEPTMTASIGADRAETQPVLEHEDNCDGRELFRENGGEQACEGMKNGDSRIPEGFQALLRAPKKADRAHVQRDFLKRRNRMQRRVVSHIRVYEFEPSNARVRELGPHAAPDYRSQKGNSEEPTAIHEPPHVTLPHELERELSSVALSVFQKTLALAEPTTVDIVTQTIASVQRCVTAALVPELRKRNGRLASTANLPNEVLCMIWQLLCVEDRVEVSHVCSSWRSLTLDTPRLWAELHYSSLREDLCFISSRPLDDSLTTNIAICRKVLPRSRSVPLIMHLEFTCDVTPFEHMVDITEALKPYCHRLESLFFDVEMPKDVDKFFDHLSSPLPKLRTLHCRARGPLLSRRHRIVLPTLPSAEIILIRMSALDCTSLQLPSVRSLHCGVDDQNDVLGIFNACPKLEAITLETGNFKLTESHATLASIRSHASFLRQVVLLDVDPELQHDLLAMLHHAAIRTLRIHYCSAVSPGDFMIFEDLEGAIDLVVSYEDDCREHRISATDASGRCRAVQHQFWDDFIAALLGQLSRGSVTTLTLPAYNWPELRSRLPVLPGVRSATFWFESLYEGTEYVFRPLESDVPPTLPGLEHLRLVYPKDLKYISESPLVLVTEVANLISSTKGPSPLATLTVDNVKLKGDMEELASLVHELRM